MRMLPVYTINDIARRHGHYPDLLPGHHNHVNFDIKELHSFVEDLLTAAAAPEILQPASPQQRGVQTDIGLMADIYEYLEGNIETPSFYEAPGSIDARALIARIDAAVLPQVGEAKPIYQVVRAKAGGGWIDVEREFYDTDSDWNRRIIYSAPVGLGEENPSNEELWKLLPVTNHYLDEPDGGSHSLLSQLQRMAADAKKYRDSLVEAKAVARVTVSADGYHDWNDIDTASLESGVHYLYASPVVQALPTGHIAKALRDFMQKTGYLRHPDVPYFGTNNGDSEEAWKDRLYLAAANAIVAEKDAELLRALIERLQVAEDAVKELNKSGGLMANTLFNLAQYPGQQLTPEQCESLDMLRKRWDAVRRLTP